MPRGLTLGLLGLILSLAAPSALAAAEVRLQLRGLTAPVTGELVVRSTAHSQPETTFPLAPVVEVPVPPDTAWVTCRGEGLWCPEVRLTEGSATLPVFAAMTVTGRAAGPRAVPTPSTGLVQGTVAGSEEHGGDRQQTIELRQELSLTDGAFRFTAPRAELDLRFAFPGAAPVYRWAVAPPEPQAPSVSLSLGVLPLQPGASVSGWARSRETDLPLRDAEVTAFPAGSSGEPASPLHTWKAVSDERGFFQLLGLQPGTFRLEVSAEGHVPQVLEAVDVEAGSETLVGTVLLIPPLRLAVQLTPPRHPNGEPWTVLLTPVLRRNEQERVEVRTDDAGRAELASLRPAEYHLKVQGADGEVLLSETHGVTADGWLALEVPIVEVAGTVNLAGEPLAATVKLEAGHGDRVELATDEAGVLSGWMRRPERPWLMATVDWREGEERRQRLVEVAPVVDDGVLSLEIDLPAGAISGEVVDGEGKPQPRYRVFASPAESSSRLTEVRGETDESGRFHLTGLEAREYLVQAGGKGWPGSEVVAVDLAGDLPVGDVRLVVWPTREVAVQVTAGGHGVTGASVSLTGLGRVPVTTGGTTDGRGRLTLQIPEEVSRAVVTVLAPSQLLWSVCLPIEGDHLALALPNAPTATLSLALSARTDLPPLLTGRQILLTGDGGFLDYQALVHWNRLRGAARDLGQEGGRGIERLRLPAIAPGRYALTWSGAPAWELAARACAGAFPDLDWIALPPGSEAELRADSSDAQARRLRELRAAGEG